MLTECRRQYTLIESDYIVDADGEDVRDGIMERDSG
jgi:hypothetical protein